MFKAFEHAFDSLVLFMMKRRLLMKTYACPKCRYLFQYSHSPGACPDCGARSIRKATVEEIREYRRIQKILEEDIRMGLWSDTPCVPI